MAASGTCRQRLWNAASRSDLLCLRVAPRSRLRRWTESHRPSLLHQQRLSQTRREKITYQVSVVGTLDDSPRVPTLLLGSPSILAFILHRRLCELRPERACSHWRILTFIAVGKFLARRNSIPAESYEVCWTVFFRESSKRRAILHASTYLSTGNGAIWGYRGNFRLIFGVKQSK